MSTPAVKHSETFTTTIYRWKFQRPISLQVNRISKTPIQKLHPPKLVNWQVHWFFCRRVSRSIDISAGTWLAKFLPKRIYFQKERRFKWTQWICHSIWFSQSLPIGDATVLDVKPWKEKLAKTKAYLFAWSSKARIPIESRRWLQTSEFDRFNASSCSKTSCYEVSKN